MQSLIGMLEKEDGKEGILDRGHGWSKGLLCPKQVSLSSYLLPAQQRGTSDAFREMEVLTYLPKEKKTATEYFEVVNDLTYKSLRSHRL